jgi:hypothetical protein
MQKFLLRAIIALMVSASCLTPPVHSQQNAPVSVTAQAQTDKPKTIEDQSISNGVYRNGAGHFTLSVPEGWRTNDDIVEPQLGIGGLSSPDNEAQLEIQQMPTEASPTAFAKKIDAEGKSLFSNYRKLSETELEVAGRHCVIVTFEFTEERRVAGAPFEMKLVARFVLMPNEYSIFLFNFVTSEALFDKQLPAFVQIMKSFHSTQKRISPVSRSNPQKRAGTADVVSAA